MCPGAVVHDVQQRLWNRLGERRIHEEILHAVDALQRFATLRVFNVDLDALSCSHNHQ